MFIRCDETTAMQPEDERLLLDAIESLVVFVGDGFNHFRKGLQQIMDQIAALQQAVDAENATLGLIATAVGTTDKDLATAIAEIKTLQGVVPPDLSPAAVTALQNVQTAVSNAAQKSAAILAALQAGDPNTVPVVTPPATSGSPTPPVSSGSPTPPATSGSPAPATSGSPAASGSPTPPASSGSAGG